MDIDTNVAIVPSSAIIKSTVAEQPLSGHIQPAIQNSIPYKLYKGDIFETHQSNLINLEYD